MMKVVWLKLKNVKVELKLLHKTDFANMDAWIELARADLQIIQSQLQITLDFRGLIQAKKDCTLLLHKFLNIEESSLRQKFRVMWLKQGDSNT